MKMNKRMKKSLRELEILQKMLFKATEFDPLLTPKQYKVYMKHLEEVLSKK